MYLTSQIHWLDSLQFLSFCFISFWFSFHFLNLMIINLLKLVSVLGATVLNLVSLKSSYSCFP